MPATTVCASLPYPLDSDPIDVANDIRQLAQAVDDSLCSLASIPLGVILPYYDTGAALPVEFLRCTGATFNPVTYPALAAHLGGSTTLPDLQQRFLRGTGGVFNTNAQMSGWADTTLYQHEHDGPSHQHTNEHLHTMPTGGAVDHLHLTGALAATGGGLHAHIEESPRSASNPPGWLYQHPANGSDFNTMVGSALDGSGSTIIYGQPSTGTNGSTHSHPVTGNTGAADRSLAHAHTINTNTGGQTGLGGTQKTSTVGQSPTNRNLPPFFNVTYIIKATP